MQNNEMEEQEVVKTPEKVQVIFISGNVDLTDKKFMEYYAYPIAELTKQENISFNISDEDGCSLMTQLLLDKLLPEEKKSNVNIFFMGQTPKNVVNKNYVTIGGFFTLEEREAAMTLSSNLDYHVIVPGKGRSIVEKNLIRRNTPEYDYMQYWLNGNRRFWEMFKNVPQVETEAKIEEVVNGGE